MSSDQTERLPRVDRFELAISRSRTMDGLWLGVAGDDSETAAAFTRVEEALNLIRQHDAFRYRRLLRDLSRIWVRLLPYGLGNYNRDARACQLDTRYVLDATVSITDIASTIVHEAAHAHLEHRGVEYREDLRHRIESICVRQELKFAHLVPHAVDLQRRLQEGLDAPRDHEFWTNAAFEQRRVAGLAGALLYLGVPAWVVSFVQRIGRGVRWLRRRGA